MKEISPNIFVIKEKRELGFINLSTNIYVFAGKNGLIFDAGYGTVKTTHHFVKEFRKIEKIVKNRGDSFNVNRIIISHSHFDHFSGLKKIRKKINVNILLTEKMAYKIKNRTAYNKKNIVPENFKKYNNFTINYLINKCFYKLFRLRLYIAFGVSFIDNSDEIIKEDTIIDINNRKWAVISTPGHCDDHISLYNKDEGILLSGDTILKSVTTWLGPPNSNLEDYKKTLHELLNLPNLKLILSAHGSPIDNPKERIHEILSHREKRENEVLKILKRSGENSIILNEIIDSIYIREGRMKKIFAEGWVVLTLEKLIAENRISTFRKGLKTYIVYMKERTIINY